MAKLIRKTQKILGSTGGANAISAFGTAQNILSGGSPTYTSDVAEIQNANFETGWSSAIPDNYNPFREDFNAVGNVATRQLAYLYETGTPEYDPETNYCLGADCKYMLGNGNYQIFQSLKNDNKGNSLSDTTSWILVYNTETGIANFYLTNITPLGREIAINWGMPDYSRSFSIPIPLNTSPYTCQYACEYDFMFIPRDKGFLVVNNVTTGIGMSVSSNYGSNRSSAKARLSKGDIIYCTNVSTELSSKITPLRGV